MKLQLWTQHYILFRVHFIHFRLHSSGRSFLDALASLRPILFGQRVRPFFWIADNLRIHQWNEIELCQYNKYQCWCCQYLQSCQMSNIKCHGISMSNVMAYQCHGILMSNVNKCQLSNVKCHGMSWHVKCKMCKMPNH